ncbi:serine protease [Streptomyces sp. TS71-3]|uniref:S1 family peptidase n=1 Tax=Streptomyces sp. TS71-3 TaxID=2733862 RepID=UPI001AFD7F4E|nr:serine protease [Streptomyces sp. TS71-3]GHJ39787.1 hypothetical protein Sm713_53960 [Streptomyces sp. TS71-3]
MTVAGQDAAQAAGAGGPGPADLDRAVLRIFDAQGEPVGVGLLVTEDQALTCAHVVSAALGIPDGRVPDEASRVQVDLPLVPGRGDGMAQGTTSARVEVWGPDAGRGAEDMAVLRLSVPPPEGRPVRLVTGRDLWSHSARAFGFPDGRPAGVWHAGLLRAGQADGWVQLDLAANGYRVSRGFSGSPVWDDELCGVVGIVVVAESGEPPASYLIPTGALASAWAPLRELALPPSPFRGLAAFRETDAAVFHGRAEETGELARLVATRSWTCLVGPSGSGKSSLAMAGVIPGLRSDGYAVAVLRPGTGPDPLSALAAALLPLLEPGTAEGEEGSRIGSEQGLRIESERRARIDREQGPRAESEPRPHIQALTTLLATHSLADVVPGVLRITGADRLLIVVDQFEELLTAEPAALDRFARVLFDAGSLPADVHVLTTLRADFLQAALDHPRIGAVLPRNPYVLRPMGARQLREVVTAAVAGVPSVSYQAGLAERILSDAGHTPGALPLLGFTLDLLWQHQRDGLLTHRAYEHLGGVAGALGQYAVQAWSECVFEEDEEDEDAGRRLLAGLIRLPMGSSAVTRRTALRSDLGDGAWRVAQRLAATRLLVTGRTAEGTETVELAHDALITGWGRLADWVAENRSFLGWREALRHDRERWELGGRTTDLLPTPATLASAEPWLREHAADLTAAEHDYLERGRARRRLRARMRRFFLSGLALVVTLAVVLGTLLAFQRRESRAQQERADSLALAQLSSDRAKADPVESTMLALAAYRTSSTGEATDALLRSYVRYAGTTRQLSGLPDSLGGYQASGDGDVVLARSTGGKAILYVHAATGRIRSEQLRQPVPALYPLVSRDGSRAGYVGQDGSLFWYRVNRSDDGAPVAGRAHRLPAAPEVEEGLYDDHRAVFSPDGRVVAAASDTHIVWWDLDRGTLGGRVRAPDGIDSSDSLFFGADNRTVLARRYTGGTGDRSVGLVAVDRITGAEHPVPVADASDSAADTSGPAAGISGPAAATNEPAAATNGPSAATNGPSAGTNEPSKATNEPAVATNKPSTATNEPSAATNELIVSGDGAAVVTCRLHDGRAIYGGRAIYEGQATHGGRPVAGGPPLRGFSERADICNLEAVDDTGRRAVLQDGNDVRLVDLVHGTVVSRADGLGAGGSEIGLAYASVRGAPTLIGMIGNRLSYTALPGPVPLDVHTAGITPGGRTVVGIAKGGARIQVRSVDDPDKVLADAARPAPFRDPSLTSDHVVVSDDGTLVADRDGTGTISVRRATTLRRTARITTAAPPPSKGEQSTLTCFFDRSGHLVTVSGTVVQEWDPHTGRQLARFDTSVYHPGTAGDGRPEVSVAAYPADDTVAVAVPGDPRVHVVDLAEGRETAHVTTGRDTAAVEFDPGGRFLAVERSGGLIELWRRRPQSREVGPLPPLGNDAHVARFVDDQGHYLVAAAGKARVYQVGSHAYGSSYDLDSPADALIDTPYDVPGAARDGTALVYEDGGPGGEGGVLPLDPALWARRLCAVIGSRDFTARERAGLPTHLPPKPACPDGR